MPLKQPRPGVLSRIAKTLGLLECWGGDEESAVNAADQKVNLLDGYNRNIDKIRKKEWPDLKGKHTNVRPMITV